MTEQPINDYNDGSGYWYAAGECEGGFCFTVFDDSNEPLAFDYPLFATHEEAVAAAKAAIRNCRDAN